MHGPATTVAALDGFSAKGAGRSTGAP